MRSFILDTLILSTIAISASSIGFSPSTSDNSDAEAAASLKDRFLRSSTSAQDLLAAKEPVQLDDVA